MKTLLLSAVALAFALAACNAKPKTSNESPPPPKAQEASSDPLDKDAVVLVGAGDIARCSDLSGATATAKLLEGIPGTVFTAGDLAIPDGTEEQFRKCYDPTWGRQKARTRPTPGNHEYHSGDAAAYFQYFGQAAGDPGKGYYSYELGSWHVLALNSNCENVGGCGRGSPQETWLRQDLAAHPSACTVAYWHHPLFSSGKKHGGDPHMKTFWEDLYSSNAEIVINGHDHDYERFAPQDPNGKADPERGIREFVAGAGGNNLRSFGPPQANSEVRYNDSFGVLKLTLHAKTYDWQFIAISGKLVDSGRGTCH